MANDGFEEEVESGAVLPLRDLELEPRGNEAFLWYDENEEEQDSPTKVTAPEVVNRFEVFFSLAIFSTPLFFLVGSLFRGVFWLFFFFFFLGGGVVEGFGNKGETIASDNCGERQK